jgi:predicted phosphodiesterase
MASANDQSFGRRKFINRLTTAGVVACLPIPEVAFSKAIPEDEHVFITPPYLQNVSSDAITIVWVTKKNCLGWVEINEEGKGSRKVFAIKNGLRKYGRIHRVRIENLFPAQKYQYSVYAKEVLSFKTYKTEYGNTIEKTGFHFSTPPAKHNELSFVVLNDMHNHPESVRHLLSNHTRQEEYDFVVLNGDMFNYLGQEEKLVSDLLIPLSEHFSSNKPFFMVQGNHEVRGDFSRNLFDYCDYRDNQSYQAFTQGPVRFVILDSGEDKEDDHPSYNGLNAFDHYREEQAEWLAKEIEKPEFKKAPFRIVFIHIPVFYSGDWHGTTHCRQLFHPLFNKGKVDLVISGHTHRYGTYAANENHHYPIMIGGGPEPGKRTIIKAKVDRNAINIVMLRDDGEKVGEFDLSRR